MEREQYAVMFRREEEHWWYVGMRRAALALLRSGVAARPDLRILDAGCGTGGTTVRLREIGSVVGIDLAQEALRPARHRGLRHLAQASVERLAFTDASFDVVTSFEVVYHLGVGDDRLALREFRRVLRPDGLLLLRLPAHDWLRGEHDRLVHTRHRYSRSEVRAKLEEAGFSVERLSWANSLLFPAAVAKRAFERSAVSDQPSAIGSRRLRGDGREPTAGSGGEPDLWMPPGPVNALLENLVAAEGLLLPRGVPLPFGLSVIALARAA